MGGRRAAYPMVAEALLVLLAYGAITVWWLWPLPSAWRDHSAYFGDGPLIEADHHFLVWVLAWGTHAILTQPLRFFEANIFHPVTGTLALSDHLLGYQPIFAPVYLWSGNPILAANLTHFVTYPLSALAAYVLARRWVGRPSALLVGGLFAFYPYRLNAALHYHQLGVQYLPLVLLFADRWLERARVRDAVALGVVFSLQSLSSFYIAYTTILALGAYLACGLVAWRTRLDRRRILGLTTAIACALIPVALTGIPYLRFRALGIVPSYDGDDAVTALGTIPVYSAAAAMRYLREDGMSLLGYGLAAVAVLPAWRGRAWPLALALALVLTGVLASFGGVIAVGGRELWSPYQLVAALVPGLSSVRLPIRFHVIAQLGLALLAGLGIERAMRRVPRVAWPLGVAALVAALHVHAARPALPLYPEAVPPAVPPLRTWLAEHGEGRPLLELPVAHVRRAARRMYLSTYHWLPIVDGYSSYGPRSAERVHWIARDLPSEASLQELVDEVDIGWILVNLRELPPHRAERWRGPHPPGLELTDAPVAEDELLFRVTRSMSADHRDRIASTTTSLGGVPLRSLVGSCAGEIRFAPGVELPDPWPAHTELRLRVEVVNHSDAPWPADGIFPAHLVQGRAVIRPAGSRLRRGVEFPLTGDVRPGVPESGSFTFRSPLWPGEYEVEVFLVQGRDRPLERCGLAPLRVPIRVE